METVAEIFLGHFQKPLNNGNGYSCDKIIPSFLRLMTFFLENEMIHVSEFCDLYVNFFPV